MRLQNGLYPVNYVNDGAAQNRLCGWSKGSELQN